MNTVVFHAFEERDIDFIFRCKNDAQLNSMTVGDFKPITYDGARKWVEGCMGDHENYKFWAVCTSDKEKRIVGWVSLSQIDKKNKSACHHGIVIGDNEYRDGTAMFEAMLLSMDYVFSVLKLHRLYGSCLSEHKVSPFMLLALGFSIEGKQRETVFRKGKYYDILNFSINESKYDEMQNQGEYEIENLIMKFVALKREYKKQNKSF